MLFVSVLIVSNMIGGKLTTLRGWNFSAALVIFPVSYIIGDIMTEVYGYAEERRLIWIGFGCNLVAALATLLAVHLPSAVFYRDQTAYVTVLGQTPRLLAASLLAYLVGGFVNAWVLAKLKVRTSGKYLWLRTITSTIVGEALDSALFNFVAFAGMYTFLDVRGVMLTEWVMKCGFEILALPATYAAVRFLKRAERMDVYDRTTNFNPLKL